MKEWMDSSTPTVDSTEYRELLVELQAYRCRALGLIASALHPDFQTQEIRFFRYNPKREPEMGQIPARETQFRGPHPNGAKTPDIKPGFAWSFNTEQIKVELERQGRKEVSLKFCLMWHAFAEQNGQSLIRQKSMQTSDSGEPTYEMSEPAKCLSPAEYLEIDSTEMLYALIHFMLLEATDYFTSSGYVTAMGAALMDTPELFEQDSFFALELVKNGFLFSEPLEAPRDRPFPEAILKKRAARLGDPEEKSTTYLSRVMSLVPMELKTELWQADVDFDLAAFHSVVKIFKRSLRQLSEAVIANLLLRDITKIKHLPKDYLNPLNPKIPSFMLPRNCLGVVLKFMMVTLSE
eukprot:GHVN01067219.1.p2 GENE.GHVN01067219.1~~GHVN01067219.1.p2  ORF type:complete len:350 (-),score=41.68 GHVN01067219.1:378-1427(-)